MSAKLLRQAAVLLTLVAVLLRLLVVVLLLALTPWSRLTVYATVSPFGLFHVLEDPPCGPQDRVAGLQVRGSA